MLKFGIDVSQHLSTVSSLSMGNCRLRFRRAFLTNRRFFLQNRRFCIGNFRYHFMHLIFSNWLATIICKSLLQTPRSSFYNGNLRSATLLLLEIPIQSLSGRTLLQDLQDYLRFRICTDRVLVHGCKQTNLFHTLSVGFTSQ